jgi:opacity protein-like surface antigen
MLQKRYCLFKGILLTAVLTSISPSVQAAIDDYYLQVHSGWAHGDDVSLKGTPFTADVDRGSLLGLGIGRKITEKFSLRLDFKYTRFEIDSVSGDPYIPIAPIPGLGLPGPPLNLSDASDNTEYDLSYSSIILNGIYTQDVNERFSIYGGLGMGVSIVESSFSGDLRSGSIPALIPGGILSPVPPNPSVYSSGNYLLPHDKQDTVFSWQLSLGAIFELNANFSFILAYAYLNPGSSDALSSTEIHNVEVALRFDF